MPLISSSQPLHDPASTSRIASARPSSLRVRASTWRTRLTAVASPGSRGSVTSPTLRILPSRDTSAPPAFALEGAEHVLRPDQLVAEDAAGDLEEVPYQRVTERVADRDSLLARG